jgi:hypothetical protein
LNRLGRIVIGIEQGTWDSHVRAISSGGDSSRERFRPKTLNSSHVPIFGSRAFRGSRCTSARS